MTHPIDADSRVPALACGRDPVSVADHARAGHLDEHELACPYCQAAAADADADWAGQAVAALQAADVEVAAPDGLLPAVMRGVWSELRGSSRLPLPTTAGAAFVSDHAVGAAVESALDGLAELEVRTIRIGSAAPRLDVAVSAAVVYLADIEALADTARGVIRDVLHGQFGFELAAADITVVDVLSADGVIL